MLCYKPAIIPDGTFLLLWTDDSNSSEATRTVPVPVLEENRYWLSSLPLSLDTGSQSRWFVCTTSSVISICRPKPTQDCLGLKSRFDWLTAVIPQTRISCSFSCARSSSLAWTRWCSILFRTRREIWTTRRANLSMSSRSIDRWWSLRSVLIKVLIECRGPSNLRSKCEASVTVIASARGKQHWHDDAAAANAAGRYLSNCR